MTDNLAMKIRSSKLMRDYTMIIVLLALMIIGTMLSDKFLTKLNLMNIVKQASIVGIISLGTTFVTIAGTRDLAIGSLVSLTGCIAVKLVPATGDIMAALAALLLGAVLGMLTGVIIAVIKGDMGDTFIITYGLLSAFGALALLVTKGFTLQNKARAWYISLGNGVLFGVLPVPAVIFIALTVVMNIILTRTKFGREVYSIGANYDAAELVGIQVEKMRIILYTISGFLCGLGGIILSARTKSATGNMGLNYEMDVLVAIAVGGIDLYGGGGTLWNTVIGVLIIAVLSSIFNRLGMGQEMQLMAKGVILILSICIETVKKGKAGE